MVGDIINVGACVLGVIALLWLIWVVAHGDHERRREDEAREFFDLHGRWPDEPEPR